MALANINDCYSFCSFLSNKAQSGSISPDEFNLIIGVANTQYFRLKLGLPEMYTQQDRQAPQEIQVTQNNSDTLRSFITRKSVPKVNGSFVVPTDFAAFVPSGYMFTSTNKGVNSIKQYSVDFVTQGERALRLMDYITPPTLEYPICTYLDGNLIVDPDGVNNLLLYYYRYPVTPVRGYTINNNDQDVYNSLTSVQLEWPVLEWENICHIAVKYWAEFLRDTELYQIEQKRIEAGQ